MVQFRCAFDGCVVPHDNLFGRCPEYDSDTERAFWADCPNCGVDIAIRNERFRGVRVAEA